MAEELSRMGYLSTKKAEEADVVILNTCVVRQSAEERVVGRLSSLKPLKRKRPNALLVVMGCFVGDDITALKKRFPYVDAFLKPSDVEGLIEFIKIQRPLADFHLPAPSSRPPVSCYIPVIQGCDRFCTYCIVRLRRGRERSRPIDEVLEEVRHLVKRGAREVVLLGQNVDAYGHDLPGKPDLADLLEAIHDVDGLWRIRFLTSHPSDMTDRIIEAVAKLPKVCEHIELPVQSGDDQILKRMGRGYTTAEYRKLIEKIRFAIPGVSIATDVIVGFPGETEEQFMNTYRLLEELRFDACHVAAYSPRPGTPAARMVDDVPPDEKKLRRIAIEKLQEKIAGEINAQLLGKTVEVLVEEKKKGKWKGRTRTHKLLFFEEEGDWRGKLKEVKVTWAGPWSMQGVLI
jgi:tRNA-2-methylthio-N6-dimethylallyladenosine synthase